MDNNIGEARRRYADRHGKFTQEDAAAFFGVSASTYKKWEQGQGMMNGHQLRAIAEKYGVTVDFLLQIDSGAVTKAQLPPSAEEQRLIRLFRATSQAGRREILEMAAFVQSRHPLNQGAEKSA